MKGWEAILPRRQTREGLIFSRPKVHSPFTLHVKFKNWFFVDENSNSCSIGLVEVSLCRKLHVLTDFIETSKKNDGTDPLGPKGGLNQAISATVPFCGYFAQGDESGFKRYNYSRAFR